MARPSRFSVSWLVVLAVACASALAGSVRPAAVAGTWYPGDPQDLSRLIDRMVDEAPPPVTPIAGPIRALVVPHAGYAYSGPTAAAAYRLVKGQAPRRVIVLGPAHRGGFHGLSIAPVSAYETPLGQIPLDLDAIERLRRSPLVVAYGETHRREHSIEMQLPFLQRVLRPGWRLIPILVGEMEGADYARAAELLRPLLDARTLLVVSGDFTHYGPAYHYRPFPTDDRVRDRLRRLDMGALEHIVHHDPQGLRDYRDRTGMTACAYGPVMVLLGLLPESARVRLVRYTTSGDLSGSYRNSVSYLGLAVTDPDPLAGSAATVPDGDGDPPVAGPLSREQMRTLHRIAVSGVASAVLGGGGQEDELEQMSNTLPPALKRPRGAFVTLWKGDELRGCIGYIQPRMPVYRTVFENGRHAARDDPRFPAVRPEELADLDIEVSVLTPPRPIDSSRDFHVGREGVLLKKGVYRAVFLPEVAVERGWDREQTLRHLAAKAGLAPDGWRQGARFEVFTSQTCRAPYPARGASARR